MITYSQVQKQLVEIIDCMALDKPVDWESLNYEALRDLAINHALQIDKNMAENTKLTQEDKYLSVLSIIAYLQMENAATWIMLERIRNEQANAKRSPNATKPKRPGS